MAALASVDELAARFERPLSDPERARAVALLDDASDLVRLHAPGLPEPPPVLVVGIVCAAVARLLRNPRGLRSETVGSYSDTRDGDGASGELRLTGAERDTLTLLAGAAFSVVPFQPPMEAAEDA